MAVKMSNQITIVEHKKIVEIKEWYLATSEMKDVTNETEGWSTAIPTIDSTKKYLWNYEETIYSLGESDTTEPVIIGVYGETGSSGASLQVKYINSETAPSTDDISKWSNTVPSPEQGKKTYMIQKLSTETEWSTPIQISGTDGKNGEASVEINNDGYWVINGEQTGVKAEGSDGKSPQITIGDNGYWYIDGNFTGTKAEGEAGKDGADIEYVYYRNKDGNTPSNPSYNSNNELTTGWSPSPQGIDASYMYEFVSVRTKRAGETAWSAFSTPVIWSKWGEKGQDGDGVEYKYYLKNNNTVPTYSATDSKWTDDPTGVSIDNQYEYVIQIKTVNGISTPAEKASLWAKYGANGSNGKGISGIVNYYTTTTSADETPSNWNTSVPELTPTNKYLWNYEEITYTDNTKTQTAAAIIGAYGDSGAGSVDFQIYSTDGFEFSEDVDSIELKTVAFYGGQKITSGATYQWKWWNPDSTATDKYENISNASNPTLTVKSTDTHAYSSIKCVMRYDGVNYEDYVTLTKKTTVYTAAIKFMGGSNIFDSSSKYLLAYVELYQGQKLVDTISADKFYNGSNVVKSGVITSDFSNESEKQDMMYFLTACDHATVGDDHYVATLGKFVEWVKDGSNIVGSKWNVVNNSSDKYLYMNNIYTDVTTNVIIISREDVDKTKDINIEVCDINTKEILATTGATVVDLNDPIVSDEEPKNAKCGQLWLNTSTNPYTLKIYTKKISTVVVYGDETRHLMTYDSAATFLYADSVIIDDNGNISLDSPNTVVFGYNTYYRAEVLKGKFYQKASEDENNTNIIYFMSIDSEITQYTSSVSGTSLTLKYACSTKSQVVSSEIKELYTWEYFSQQNGGTVYTSIPLDGYEKDDLWIISDLDVSLHSGSYTELFDKFGSGTMLRANSSSTIFNQSHWMDAQSETTEIINNVKQYFNFNANDGLKIGRQDEKFYVQISAERMSFYDNTGDDAQEVVYISNSTANIDNIIVEGSATFECNAAFNQELSINQTVNNQQVGFVWKIEANGSLSLAVSS